MTQPEQPAAGIPLNWQISHGVTPNGQRVCQLVLAQGSLAQTLTMVPEDLERLGQQLLDAARQARTGLIVPTGPLPFNGHRATPAAAG